MKRRFWYIEIAKLNETYIELISFCVVTNALSIIWNEFKNNFGFSFTVYFVCKTYNKTLTNRKALS